MQKNSVRFFLVSYAIFLILGAILLGFFSKGEIVIWFNENSFTAGDYFFMVITQLGVGALFAIPILLALFKKYIYAILGTISLILIGIFSFIFKKVLFAGMPRPTAYFQNGELNHFIEGFDYHSANTFPSGHTMTAFGMLFFICLLCPQRWVGAVAFLLAFLAGISRVYLLQHFFVDIYVGSILGILSVFLAYWFSFHFLVPRYKGLQRHLSIFSGKK